MGRRKEHVWTETPKPDLSEPAKKAIIDWGLREFQGQPEGSEHYVATYFKRGKPEVIVVLRDLRQPKKR